MKSKQKRKILFVIPSIEAGGAERVLCTVVAALNKDKYEIGLVLFNEPSASELIAKLNINKIYYLPKRHKLDFFLLICKLISITSTIKPDVVISSLMYTNIINVFHSFFLKYSPKIVLWEHNVPINSLRSENFSFLKKFIISKFYNKADKIIVVSAEIANEFIKHYQVQPEKITIIYNPIDINEICSQINSDSVVMSKVSAPNLIAVGRLEGAKRFDRLLNIICLAKEKLPRIKLFIAGRGTLEVDLMRLSKELGIEDNVVFLGFRKDIFSLIASADIFILTSDYEGFPMVLLEAMVCKTPIISSNFKGANELIKDGENGFLINKDRIDDYVDAIINLTQDPELRNQVITNASVGVQRFTTSQLIKDYERLFE